MRPTRLTCLLCLCTTVAPAHAQTPPANGTQPPTVPPQAPRPSPSAPVTAYPLPDYRARRWHFTLAVPSPAFFQTRENRPRRTQLQFPFAVYGGLGDKKGWGHFFLASENVLSTDAFDTSARIGIRLGVEHALYAPGPLLTSEIGVVTNQRMQNQAFGANIGTRFALPLRIGIGKPNLQLNLIGYENRRRLAPDVSPQHTARDVLVSSTTLSLPAICFGEGDTSKRPHLLFRTRAWFFTHEQAAPGYSPGRFESRYETALIIPTRSVRKKTAYLRAIALSFISGANDANAYAPQRNFRCNFILVDTRQLLDELADHGILPKMPEMKFPSMRVPGEKPSEKPASSSETPTDSVKSSTTPESGKSLGFR